MATMRHTIKRVRRVWAELDYAQRRLFEIRTGVPATRVKGSPRELGASLRD